ncbi:Rieske (2Fe-2S) protein [Hamadaea tsunoensis]|uniref:Rieske (2Fe-2S) protein n=1 Tax=Hamadaea tsunoensis TaxID=53368 RepID=UPI000482BDAD|nr:Rieske (2Fe-2S) protein [Hamadaea tsunoensis]
MIEDSTNSTTSRRAIFAGVGAVGAAALLAACSDGSDTPAAASSSAAPTASEPATEPSDDASQDAPAGDAVTVSAAGIAVGGGKIFNDQGVVVTQPTAGTYKAFTNLCSHQQCPLSDVSGGTINCNCHFSKFSIKDGAVVSPPASQPLKEYPVKANGTDLSITVE